MGAAWSPHAIGPSADLSPGPGEVHVQLPIWETVGSLEIAPVISQYRPRQVSGWVAKVPGFWVGS